MMISVKQPEEFRLTKIFIDSEYVIPIYQRSYAWESIEIEKLLTDIYDSNGKYYLGNLIVDEIAPKTFSVIDGQQRLTTLFLLLAFLKDFSLAENSLRFEAREKSNVTLKEIYEKQEVSNDTFCSPEIIDGFEVIKKFFEAAEKNCSGYTDLFKSKLSNILLIRTQVPKQIDLNHYFEVMNTRGEQLEIHEIAKGKILGVIDRDIPEYKAVAALIWDKCSQMDCYIQMSFDTESRKRLFGNNWDSFLCTDAKDLKEKVSVEQDIHEERFSLLAKLENPVFVDHDGLEDDGYENERFESIVSFPNLLLIVNETMQRSSNEDDASLDDKKIIDILQAHWYDGEAALKFIFNLLKYRFLFDKYIIKREFAKDYKEDGKWSLQKLQMYYDQNRKQEKPSYKLSYATGEGDSDKRTEILRSLQAALRITYTSPKTMHWIAKALLALNENQDVDLAAVLETYACSKIEQANYNKASGFGIDRIVFTYLDYILDRDGISKIPNFQFQFRTSIEHFYPQHSIEKEQWEADVLNSLGNLALITVSSNSKFSNLDPQSKVSSYPETINQSPKLKLMSELMKANNNIWSKELVREHETKMLSLLADEIERHKRK